MTEAMAAAVEETPAEISEDDALAAVFDKMTEGDTPEEAPQEAIEAGERDEVSAIRSTAWQISVCAAAIRARKPA